MSQKETAAAARAEARELKKQHRLEQVAMRRHMRQIVAAERAKARAASREYRQELRDAARTLGHRSKAEVAAQPNLNPWDLVAARRAAARTTPVTPVTEEL